MNSMLVHLVESLGWSLLHFLWEGAAIGLLLVVALLALKRCRPSTRYLACCAAMTLLAFAPVATFAWIASQGIPAAPVGELEIAPFAPTASATGAPEEASSLGLVAWLVAGWLAGVALFTTRLALGLARVHRLRATSRGAIPAAWEAVARRLSDRLGVRRTVRLVRSTSVSVPSAVGWLRPVILLPAATMSGLSTDQVQAVLAHELAHIRRHDYLVNLLQSILEALLFYHPVVWWVSSRLRVEREYCCDDLAVDVCGDALDYAKALTELEARRGVHAATRSLGLSSLGGSLMDRIRRLIDPTCAPAGPSGLLATLLFGTVLSAATTAAALSSPVCPPDEADAAADIVDEPVILVLDESGNVHRFTVSGTLVEAIAPQVALGAIGQDQPPVVQRLTTAEAVDVLGAAQLATTEGEVLDLAIGADTFVLNGTELQLSGNVALTSDDLLELRADNVAIADMAFAPAVVSGQDFAAGGNYQVVIESEDGTHYMAVVQAVQDAAAPHAGHDLHFGHAAQGGQEAQVWVDATTATSGSEFVWVTPHVDTHVDVEFAWATQEAPQDQVIWFEQDGTRRGYTFSAPQIAVEGGQGHFVLRAPAGQHDDCTPARIQSLTVPQGQWQGTLQHDDCTPARIQTFTAPHVQWQGRIVGDDCTPARIQGLTVPHGQWQGRIVGDDCTPAIATLVAPRPPAGSPAAPGMVHVAPQPGARQGLIVEVAPQIDMTDGGHVIRMAPSVRRLPMPAAPGRPPATRPGGDAHLQAIERTLRRLEEALEQLAREIAEIED